jgi:hypothetical protein
MDNGAKPRILSKEEILAADDIPTEIVEVPEWGGAVVVHGMSGQERLEWSNKVKGADGSTDVEKAMFYSIVYGVQEPKFDESDIPALKKKSGAALDRVARAWLRMSGIGEEELLKARGNS